MVEHPTLTAPPVRRSAAVRARGVLYVHSVPRALAPHVEWAVAAVLETDGPLRWLAQPMAPGEVRTELAWTGRAGTAARLVSSLRRWDRVRMEVTEDPSDGYEGERYALTPTLGVFRAAIAANGDLQVGEERLRGALARASGDPGSLRHEIEQLLGGPWDAELEPFRGAADGTPVHLLHRTG